MAHIVWDQSGCQCSFTALSPGSGLLRRNKGEELADEIMAMVEEGEESGAIEQNEKELIANIFEFNSMTADDVMRHRTDMVTLALDDDDQTILDTIQSSGLSRFPVYKEDIDDIVGILSARDYLINRSKPQPQPLEQLLRPAYFVPESVRADVLFRDMQNRKIHMALVVDEYGAPAACLPWRTCWRSWWARSTMSLTPRRSRRSSSSATSSGRCPAPPTWRT